MKIFINDKEVLTIADTAKQFGVTVKTIYEWLKENQLESIMHGRRRYITVESIERWELERGKRAK